MISDANLMVGLSSEPEFLFTLLKIFAGALGCFLLVFGKRFERLVFGIFFLALGLLVGWSLVPAYPAILLVALGVFAVGMALSFFVPRLAVAVATLWVVPALFAGYLLYTGSFDAHIGPAVVLIAVGFVGAILFPWIGAALLSAGLGALLLEAAFSFGLDYPLILAIAVACAAWQAFFLPATAPLGSGKMDSRMVRLRAKKWLKSIGWAAVALLAGLLCLSLFAPAIAPALSSEPGRMKALKASGGLGPPGLVFSAEDSFYLGGRAFPIALFAQEPGLATRLSVLFTGRDPRSAIHKIRAVKDASELDKMRRAAQITSQSFADVQPLIKPGVNEKDIEKAILDSFRRNGATGLAFECIVASGANAVNPHYMRNSATMKRGLVVIDIGCAYQCYASDMTRTFPVSGAWSPQELKLVETVVAAGDAARSILKAGVTMSQLDRAARDVITKAGFGEYFIHALGHPVGLDVHDPPVTRLEPGMVVTIEPGIYIPTGSKADKAFWDLGVRVEDDYLVTKHGYEELTNFPKIPKK